MTTHLLATPRRHAPPFKLLLAGLLALLCTLLMLEANAQNAQTEQERIELVKLIANDTKQKLNLPLEGSYNFSLQDIREDNGKLLYDFIFPVHSNLIPDDDLQAIANDSINVMCYPPETYAYFSGIDLVVIIRIQFTDQIIDLERRIQDCPF